LRVRHGNRIDHLSIGIVCTFLVARNEKAAKKLILNGFAQV
jgi:hypothetical protein